MPNSGKPKSIVAETKATLERIETENARLKAFIVVTRETALAEAALADVRAATGDTQRPLHGMAIAVKDIIDVAGIVSPNWRRSLFWMVLTCPLSGMPHATSMATRQPLMMPRRLNIRRPPRS